MINQLYQFISGLYQAFVQYQEPLTNALLVTLKTVGISMVIALLVGTLLAGLMHVLARQNNFIARFLFSPIHKIVTILGAYPALVFIIALLPVTRMVFGHVIDPYATIVTISILATFFFTVRFQRVLMDDEHSAKHGVHDTAIYILSASATADLLGGGGLCGFMLNYGYSRSDMDVILLVFMIYLPVILVTKLFAAIVYLLFFRRALEKPTFHQETVRKYGTWIQS